MAEGWCGHKRIDSRKLRYQLLLRSLSLKDKRLNGLMDWRETRRGGGGRSCIEIP